MAGKYKAYPEYRDSGVEWLGEVPSDWDVWKWKHTLLSPMAYGANEAALDDDVKNPRYIRITDMNSDGSLRDDTFKSLPLEAAKNHLLKDGDILVARTGATVGKSFLYKDKLGAACFAGYLIRARINKNIVDPEFVSWYLQSDQYWKYISSSQIQATLQNVSAEKYGDMEIAIPSKKQDRLSIVNFLDHETAKIDTLIEKQQQLIQLLKEKRQAVISHAVTKGLNPDVPMKDSGVEWLGEVPAGWVVMQIRRILPFMEQGKSPECESRPAEDNEWGVLKTSCVNHAEYRSGENKFLPDGIAPFPEYEVKVGDVLMSRASGSIDLIGSVAYVFETRPKILLSDKIFRLGLSKKISGIFFKYLMQSSYMRTNIRVAISGAEGMANNITKGSVLSFVFALPNLHEQSDIVKYLDKETALFAALLDQAERMVSLLHERRTALISAAVTGKIDVRLHASRPTGSA
jgi:type I restriction enzyme S subunit